MEFPIKEFTERKLFLKFLVVNILLPKWIIDYTIKEYKYFYHTPRFEILSKICIMQIYSNIAKLIDIWYLCWQYVSFVVAFRWTIKLKYSNKIEVKDKPECLPVKDIYNIHIIYYI